MQTVVVAIPVVVLHQHGEGVELFPVMPMTQAEKTLVSEKESWQVLADSYTDHSSHSLTGMPTQNYRQSR